MRWKTLTGVATACVVSRTPRRDAARRSADGESKRTALYVYYWASRRRSSAAEPRPQSVLADPGSPPPTRDDRAVRKSAPQHHARGAGGGCDRLRGAQRGGGPRAADDPARSAHLGDRRDVAVDRLPAGGIGRHLDPRSPG